MKIAIVGTGYVGLVSGICLAEMGHEVICVDNNPEKVAQINAKVSPIYEKGLDELLAKNVGTRLIADTNLAAAVMASDVTIIAVGTPFDGDEIDLGYIRQAAAEIGAALRDKTDFHAVVVKSTVVPGTTDSVVLPILERHSGRQAGRDFGVGMNPEFLREGAAIEDFMHPDRIVIGGMDDRTRELLVRIYAPFAGVDILATTNKTAEPSSTRRTRCWRR